MKLEIQIDEEIINAKAPTIYKIESMGFRCMNENLQARIISALMVMKEQQIRGLRK